MFIIDEIGSVLLQPFAMALDGLGDLSHLSGEELEKFGDMLKHGENLLEQARAHLTGHPAPPSDEGPAEAS